MKSTLPAWGRRVSAKAVGLTVVATALAGGQLALSPAAHATTTKDTVMVTTQRMSQPTLNSTQHGWYAKGKHLTLTCYQRGQAVKGWGSSGFKNGWDNLWYKVSDGYWVADVDLSTGTNNPITPACINRTTTLDKFVKANLGKSLANIAGTYRGECVSLVSQYLNQVYRVRTGAWGNAVDYRSGGTGGKHLAAAGFHWSTSRSFHNGDVLVWGGGKLTSRYGHIAVWYKGKIFDQNYAGRRTAGLDPFFASGYLGHWRK